jgi:hypothetical protein
MHVDGAGLSLRVAKGPDGAIYRSWIYRYSVAETVVSASGKSRQRERQMGLGPCDASTIATATASLALARKLAAKTSEDRRLGDDPINKRTAARKAVIIVTTAPTFGKAADDYIAKFECRSKSEQHRTQWIKSLEAHVLPIIGRKPVDTITTDDMITILNPIWHRIPETASRVRGRIETVLDLAGLNGSTRPGGRATSNTNSPHATKSEPATMPPCPTSKPTSSWPSCGPIHRRPRAPLSSLRSQPPDARKFSASPAISGIGASAGATSTSTRPCGQLRLGG